MKFALFHPAYALIAFLLLLPACAGEEHDNAGPATSSEGTLLSDPSAQDTSLLTLLRLDLLRGAFQSLDAYTFTRIVQTEQLDEDGGMVACESRAVHYQLRNGDRAPIVEPLTAAGAFDFGLFGRFVSDADAAALSSLSDALIPEDPPYLSARSRENFIYSTAPDTLINGFRAEVLEIRVIPDATEQPTKYARLYYDPQSYVVVALHQEHTSPALVFRESTSLYVQIRPGPDERWLPDTTSVSTRIHLPLTKARHFRTTSRFTDYGRALH